MATKKPTTTKWSEVRRKKGAPEIGSVEQVAAQADLRAQLAAPAYNPTHWKDPDASFAPDDQSLEARMWRLAQR